MAIGFDVGTYNLVSCNRDENKDFETKREVNAFIEFPLEDRSVFNMMKSAGVPLIERSDVAYALGESAVNMAYTFSKIELKRPMTSGCVNPKERDAFQILNLMIHSLLDGVTQEKETLYFSVPANAINQETDAEYHEKILSAIFSAFKSDEGFSVDPHPINEALALVYAELGKKMYTGIGVSCGAGMVNICFAMFGNPVFSFSLVNSGDWIDKQAARATGETPAFINKEKTKIDLSATPVSLVERAIQTQYRIMIEKTATGIKEGLSKLKETVRTDGPVDIVVSGGCSSPKGFAELFQEVLASANLSIEIGEVIRPSDPLYSVARGCLVAAEASLK